MLKQSQTNLILLLLQIDLITVKIMVGQITIKIMVGQAYDGAAVFSGSKKGVQLRMRVHSAHSIYIHCACHRLQLACIQAAEKVQAIKKMFTMMRNLWKLFYYSPMKAENLKGVQAALKLPKLKIVKPSDTRWLSHERCMQAIKQNLPAIITNLQHLHETTGNSKAFGISTLLTTFTAVSCCFLILYSSKISSHKNFVIFVCTRPRQKYFRRIFWSYMVIDELLAI